MKTLSRRSLLKLAGLGAAGGTAALGVARASGQEQPGNAMRHAAHTMCPVGRVSTESFDPGLFARSWNFSHLPAAERSRFYRETPRPDGSRLREFDLVAVDRQ